VGWKAKRQWQEWQTLAHNSASDSLSTKKVRSHHSAWRKRSLKWCKMQRRFDWTLDSHQRRGHAHGRDGDLQDRAGIPQRPPLKAYAAHNQDMNEQWGESYYTNILAACTDALYN
jgi:hypothetical protein